ncbi:MAG: hypothetical protein J6V02_00215 [Bacteroidaceae bacterium]|nr:hypothetical protein [Bacteroidaceae bacterium]
MEKYKWNFTTIGGVTRVCIDEGEAIAHLNELDQKLWTVLSCPLDGIVMDKKTLSILDTNADGRIHVNEVVAASQWLTKVLKDANLLLKKENFIPLSAFNEENAEGKQLKASAIQILKNLGLKKDNISINDTADSIAIFSKTKFNGDGVITEFSTDDSALKAVIADCIAATGGTMDRSGDNGITADQIEKFYAALEQYKAWKDAAGEAEFPYGDNTEAALQACLAIKEKVADYFMRCKLAAFNSDSTTKLDATAERIAAISDKDLSLCNEEIAQYPLARVTAAGELPLNESVNPAWQAAIAKIKALVFDVDYPGVAAITEADWNAVMSKFSAYTAWKAAKAGDMVEKLGYDRVSELLNDNCKEALLAIVAEDKALEVEANSIESVDKLLHLYRDFYSLLCNFVTFSDFYKPKSKALFLAGNLFIDQRCCELCIKVPDMAKSAASSGLSGMYILYCDCVAKHSAAKMTIAAVVTDGDINDLRVGKNAIFYDRDGNDWDATVVKIVDNPISIRQAFFAPYRKMAQTVEDTINKFAAEKDAKIMKDATSKISAAPAAAAAGTAPAEVKPPFDIAKFAGIFAAIGMAVGALGTALATVFDKFIDLSIWQVLLVVVVILLIISGPSMLMAKMKLRKRELSPLLNANGWAMNAKVKVNETFGATLTKLAKMPLLKVKTDPFADKEMPKWKKWTITVFVALVAIFAILFFNNKLACIGLEWNNNKEEAPVECVEAVPDNTVVAE